MSGKRKAPDADDFQTGGAISSFVEISDHESGFVGRVLGDYTVHELIAKGGMGAVYRATRTDGSFDREVAIKVSPVSGIDESLARRFRQEQSVLATLNHPNIAQLYDAGITREAWPYIVMELVEGVTITSYCESQALSPADVAKLILRVVDAVSFAHSRLIVHRDIKPSNVMVNDDGQPKLLDFGIAKLLGAGDDALTRVRPLTPAYASPEQIVDQPVTTASDTYQLGQLLYECATGHQLRPEETLSDVLQVAARGEPVPVRWPADTSVPRDLRNIVEQCLRVDPGERYESAAALAADLRAFLDGYPVAASGQGAGYQLRKLAQRNRPTTITIALALLAIISGSSWYTWKLDQARQAAEDEARSSQRLLNTMSQLVADTYGQFLKANSNAAIANDVPVNSAIRTVLNRLGTQIELELVAEPESSAYLRRTLGTIRYALEDYEEAETQLLKSLDDSKDRPDVGAAMTMLSLARVSSSMGRGEEARQWFDEAAVILDPMVDRLELDQRVDYALHGAVILFGEGRIDEAATLLQPLTEDPEVLAMNDKARLGELYFELGLMQLRQGDYEASKSSSRLALQHVREADGDNAPGLIRPNAALGAAELRTGDYMAAKQAFERSLEISIANFGPDSFAASRAMTNLGAAVYEFAEYERSIELYGRSIEIKRALFAEAHPTIATTLSNMCNSYNKMGDMVSAIETCADSVHEGRKLSIGQDRALAHSLRSYGTMLLEYGDIEASRTALTESVSYASRYYGDDNANTAGWYAVLAVAHLRADEPALADEFAELAYTVSREARGEDHPLMSWPLQVKGEIAAAKGDSRTAIELLERASELRVQRHGEPHPSTSGTMLILAKAHLAAGNIAEARTWLERARPAIPEIAVSYERIDFTLADAEIAMQEGRPFSAPELAELGAVIGQHYPKRRDFASRFSALTA